MIGDRSATRKRRLLLATLSLMLGTAVLTQAAADPLILQGSTTFNRRVMEPHEAAIEAKSGQEITVIPNRTMLGIIALMEGRAHMAMISASLESEVSKMKKAMPGLDYDRLKAFEISSTRVAFVVNPVKSRSQGVAGSDQEGSDRRNHELERVGRQGRADPHDHRGRRRRRRDHRRNRAAQRPAGPWAEHHLRQDGAATHRDRRAGAECLGIAQLSLAKQKGLPEIVTEKPVEQSLSLITLGEPTPAMKAVIDAARAAVEKTM